MFSGISVKNIEDSLNVNRNTLICDAVQNWRKNFKQLKTQ